MKPRFDGLKVEQRCVKGQTSALGGDVDPESCLLGHYQIKTIGEWYVPNLRI